MKKYILAAGLALASIGTVVSTTQSCVALATSSIGIAIIKKILIGGITKGLGIFKDKNSFLGNQIIAEALPQRLKDLNSTLSKMGLNSLVEKQKDYIAQAAAFTVNIAEPILVNTVNNMTQEDAAKIAQGGTGAATAFLKEKSKAQLIAAISPKVNAKLNEYGIVRTLNSALAASGGLNSLLGAISGNQNTQTSLTSGFSNLAAEQMVNGLFGIIDQYERTSPENPMNIIKQ